MGRKAARAPSQVPLSQQGQRAGPLGTQHPQAGAAGGMEGRTSSAHSFDLDCNFGVSKGQPGANQGQIWVTGHPAGLGCVQDEVRAETDHRVPSIVSGPAGAKWGQMGCAVVPHSANTNPGHAAHTRHAARTDHGVQPPLCSRGGGSRPAPQPAQQERHTARAKAARGTRSTRRVPPANTQYTVPARTHQTQHTRSQKGHLAAPISDHPRTEPALIGARGRVGGQRAGGWPEGGQRARGRAGGQRAGGSAQGGCIIGSSGVAEHRRLLAGAWRHTSEHGEGSFLICIWAAPTPGVVPAAAAAGAPRL